MYPGTCRQRFVEPLSGLSPGTTYTYEVLTNVVGDCDADYWLVDLSLLPAGCYNPASYDDPETGTTEPGGQTLLGDNQVNGGGLWVSGDHLVSTPYTFTTPTTNPPTGTSLDTGTGAGTTDLPCETKTACSGTFTLLGTVTVATASDVVNTKRLKKHTLTVVLATTHFHVAGHSTGAVHFRLSAAGKRFLHNHPHANVSAAVAVRTGRKHRLVTTRVAIAVKMHGGEATRSSVCRRRIRP